MYRRLSGILLPILTLALIGTGVWGYQEHQEKNSILIKAENQYQRAFHDLSYYMGQLEQELGKTTAVRSASQDYQKRRLIQVWRMTSQAQNQISQLPLTLLPFTETEEFLDKIANFSYRTSIRDLTKEPLSDKENKTLITLYSRSKQLSKQLDSIQTEVLNQSLRWMDVEIALASDKNMKNNSIIDGFKVMDKEVSGYGEVEWGPSVQSLYEKRSVQALSGPVMDEKKIRRKASAFIKDVTPDQWLVTENGKGTEYNSYSVSVEKKNGNVLSMDYTKRGGKLLWYINPRGVQQEMLSLDQAREKAEIYLQQNNYKLLTPVNYDHYDKVTSITFAVKEDGIVYYPKKVTVRVAMDNGDIVGLQAQDYVFESPKKTLDTPKMTLEEASKLLNPAFRKLTSNLSYIENELNQEVLCYEFTGAIHEAHYRIFLNADTGAEEKIETIEPLEAAFGQERGS
ncbi:MAG: germination protein YpeB [Paenibacillaceae bacterium]